PLTGLAFLCMQDSSWPRVIADVTLIDELSTTLVVPHTAQTIAGWSPLGGWSTKVNICNPQATPNTVTIRYYTRAGANQYTTTLSIPAQGSVSYNLSSLLPTDQSFTGGSTLITATQPVAAFALYYDVDKVPLENGTCYAGISAVDPSTITSQLLTSETIGPQGGALAAGGFSLTIPTGVFTTPVELKLYKISGDDNNPFGEGRVTDTFRVTGLPDDFPGSLSPVLNYTGPLTDESFIVVGEEVLISSQSSPSMAYHLFPATQQGGLLTHAAGMTVSGSQLSKGNFASTLSDTTASGSFLDFFAITGWATAGPDYGVSEIRSNKSSQGHFLIRYPSYFVSRSDLDPLFQYLEEAYAVYETMGFSYGGRTSWPVEVTVLNLASDTYGLFCKSIWGNNSATLQFNQNKLGNLSELRQSTGHEFFHFVQYLYDSRNNYSRGHDTAYSISLHWLDEAAAVWAEEKFTSTPNYVSAIRDGHKMAPFDGMEAGAAGNILQAGYHGYGMSAFIKYLVSEYGESIITDIYLKILDQQHPVEAINQNLGVADNLFMRWEHFLRNYVTGTIYAVTRPEFAGSASGIFRIQTEADTIKTFTENYPDLSAKLFIIRLDDPDISPAKAVSFSIDQDLCDITLFKYRNSENLIQYISHSTTKTLTQKNLRSLTDDGYYLVVMVTNSNYFAPYINTKQVKLDIQVASTAAAMSLAASPNTLGAGGISTVTATVTDDIGIPVEGETVSFTTSSGSLSAGSADTDAGGIASVNYTAPGSAPPGGTATITATTTNAVTATCTISINSSQAWTNWPGPQWCPVTGPAGTQVRITDPGGDPDEVYCVYHSNANLKFEKPKKDFDYNGIMKEYSESGSLWFATPYVDDKKNGIQTEYYESGARKVETPYIDDEPHGMYREYYESGNIKHEIPYAATGLYVIAGTEKWYYESGNLAGEMPYVNGKKEGMYTTYFESGEVRDLWPYVNGKAEGNAQTFDESGTLIACKIYSNGMPTGASCMP
ncbi:MAG: DUF5719 family protein, partial [Pseudomonadota bacterium]